MARQRVNPASPCYVAQARVLGFALRLTVAAAADPSRRLRVQRLWCIVAARAAIGARVGGRLKTLQTCGGPAALPASPALSAASVSRASPASLASPAFGASLTRVRACVRACVCARLRKFLNSNFTATNVPSSQTSAKQQKWDQQRRCGMPGTKRRSIFPRFNNVSCPGKL